MINNHPTSQNKKIDDHEAWVAVSKKKAQTLLNGLKSLPKEDPIVKDLKKELKDVLQYWHRIESVSVVDSENNPSQPPKKGKVVKGKAGSTLLKRKGIK